MSARQNAKNLRRKVKRGGPPLASPLKYNLPGYEVVSYEETPDEINVVVRAKGQPPACIYGCPASVAPEPAGSKIQGFADKPIDQKPCRVAIDRQRYYCEGGKHYFSEPLPGLHPRRRMTMQLFHYIREEAVYRTFADVARKVGLCEKTIRNVVAE